MSVLVLIADDHPVLRQGLRALLESEPDIEVIAEAEDGYECIEIAKRLSPDVIVVDVNMPGCSGLDALDELGNLFPGTKVLVLTMHDDLSYVRHVLAGGGSGYILKQTAAAELVSAVRVVSEGGVFIHPHHAQLLALSSAPTESPDAVAESGLMARYESLSRREEEVFRMVCLGHTNAEMASLTGLSVKTVETYKARLVKKLGVSSRSALVRAGIELGIAT